MRLIDADAAIETFEGLTELVIGEGAALTKALIFAGLKSSSVIPTVGDWISVKDRMPLLCETVLFIGKNCHGSWFRTKRGYFDGTFWHCDDVGTVYASTPVTHWMPLPEPPKEAEQG